MSSYYTSPFAMNSEPSYILVWDGGMYPRLYFFDPKSRLTHNLGALFYLSVNIYSIFAQHFGPFKINENVIKDELSIAGKVMAYISVGTVMQPIVDDLEKLYYKIIDECFSSQIPELPFIFSKKFKEVIKGKNYTEDNILTSFHHFLQKMLMDSIKMFFLKNRRRSDNICFVGGAALNIKWNSKLRESGEFKNVWVCPFPNDSGSSIGSACCELNYRFPEIRHLKWNVFSGVDIVANSTPDGWTKKECTLKQLAEALHLINEPIIFLNGKAELKSAGAREFGVF